MDGYGGRASSCSCTVTRQLPTLRGRGSVVDGGAASRYRSSSARCWLRSPPRTRLPSSWRSPPGCASRTTRIGTCRRSWSTGMGR